MVQILKESVRGRGREALTQLALITVLYVGYRAGRVFASGQESRAFDNARFVLNFERVLYLPNEVSVQTIFTSSNALAVSANAYYAIVHFPFAVGSLLWLWVYRAQYYRWTRNMMVALTTTALVFHVLFPLAPPRMLQDLGFIDLAAEHGQSVYSAPETGTLSNQFAAMPSLHVGWALLLSLTLFLAIQPWWRWLFLAHPAITAIVVIGTANHYWLDEIVAALVILITMAFLASSKPQLGESDSDLEKMPDNDPSEAWAGDVIVADVRRGTTQSRARRLFVALREDNAFAQLVRFALVGGVSNIVYLLAFVAMRDSGLQLANLVGALVSTALANELHRRLTFRAADRVGWFAAQWEGGGLAVLGLGLSATMIVILGDLVPNASAVVTATCVIAVNAMVGALRFVALRVWVFALKDNS